MGKTGKNCNVEFKICDIMDMRKHFLAYRETVRKYWGTIILLFVLFAVPIPVVVLGSLLSLLWFVSSLIKISTFVEIIMSIFGVIIGATYIFIALILYLKKK